MKKVEGNEKAILDKLGKIDLSKLETITIDEVRQQKPRIFGEESFDFVVNDLSKALVVHEHKTRVGSGDLYVLDTLPRIYTFGNAYDQLEQFYRKNNLTRSSKITYVKKFIPEGKESYDTTYLFKVFGKTK